LCSRWNWQAMSCRADQDMEGAAVKVRTAAALLAHHRPRPTMRKRALPFNIPIFGNANHDSC
jgi:hypothetical protein